MTNQNSSVEEKIALIQHQITNRIRKKERKIKEINRAISKIERAILHIKEENNFEDLIQKLKQQREKEEIECFKEIMKLHNEIKNLKNVC